MTVTQSDPVIARLIQGLGVLHIDRTDISFHNIDTDRVRVAITVHNRGPGRSRRTRAVLRSAPLGAFVPWSPLTSVEVPELDAGESIEVSAVVPRPATAPAGFFDDHPPRKPTAVGAGGKDPGRDRRNRDRRSGGRSGFAALSNWLVDLFRWNLRDSPESATDPLPTELPDLLSEANPHWAGNINVLMGDTDVERHMAQALRIYPARTNLAMFFVGDHRSDQYMFELKGLGAEWDAALYGARNLDSLLTRPEDNPAVQQSQWIKLDKTQIMLLAFRPPDDCPTADLEVHVRRRLTGQRAIVEFSFDPSACGPGCYAV